MKKAKIIAAIAASAVITGSFIAGCAKSVSVNTGGIMLDIDVAPTQTAAYEQYTKAALDEYFAVANEHLDEGGDIDIENEQVIAAAIPAAAKVFAYACYNERTLDQYVFFASQEGETDISAGSATALKQEYYLRVNEQAGITCGYRYHYTIKMVVNSDGLISKFKGAFESARTRITDETDILYRLEGSNIRIGAKNDVLGINLLECDWKTGKDWGEHDVIMRKSEVIDPDKIREDIESVAGEDNITMRANINILADNILKNAVIVRDESSDEGAGYLIIMTVDTEVANRDRASLKMLRKANGSDDCEWISENGDSGLSIAFRIWSNGLFRMYSVSEKWQGKISGFSGTADSSTVYYYSYSDRDCDMTGYLKMLAEAKAAKGD